MWANVWELHLAESCCNRNTSIIETFKLPQCKKSSLYICASWNLKHQGLRFNLPNTMFLSVMMSKNYPVNLSNVNFTESGHRNSIKFLQVNSLCRKILHQIDTTVSRHCTQLRNSFGASAMAPPLQSRASVTQGRVGELKDLCGGSVLFLTQSHTEASHLVGLRFVRPGWIQWPVYSALVLKTKPKESKEYDVVILKR